MLHNKQTMHNCFYRDRVAGGSEFLGPVNWDARPALGRGFSLILRIYKIDRSHGGSGNGWLLRFFRWDGSFEAIRNSVSPDIGFGVTFSTPIADYASETTVSMTGGVNRTERLLYLWSRMAVRSGRLTSKFQWHL